jgi:hypothetical protein
MQHPFVMMFDESEGDQAADLWARLHASSLIEATVRDDDGFLKDVIIVTDVDALPIGEPIAGADLDLALGIPDVQIVGTAHVIAQMPST